MLDHLPKPFPHEPCDPIINKASNWIANLNFGSHLFFFVSLLYLSLSVLQCNSNFIVNSNLWFDYEYNLGLLRVHIWAINFFLLVTSMVHEFSLKICTCTQSHICSPIDSDALTMILIRIHNNLPRLVWHDPVPILSLLRWQKLMYTHSPVRKRRKLYWVHRDWIVVTSIKYNPVHVTWTNNIYWMRFLRYSEKSKSRSWLFRF